MIAPTSSSNWTDATALCPNGYHYQQLEGRLIATIFVPNAIYSNPRADRKRRPLMRTQASHDHGVQQPSEHDIAGVSGIYKGGQHGHQSCRRKQGGAYGHELEPCERSSGHVQV